MPALEFQMGNKLGRSSILSCPPLLVVVIAAQYRQMIQEIQAKGCSASDKPLSIFCFQYIVAICCLLFLEVAVIVAIFFKIDWGKFETLHLWFSYWLCFSCHIYPRLLSQQITTYTGQKNTDFEILMSFHVKISRAIMLLIMVAQVNSKTKG
ncbi:hypothetical protein POTOM_056971 [Populus tomentosa]|uniref:Uncharacterized protein n=1 Tax=Populus tomentosa TaxID=118781 RepID=A0A8X7XVL8_POPTO|nr:hypothetical protein POTOM_056971 [Populus tomentosa]